MKDQTPTLPAQSKHRTQGNDMTGPRAAVIYRTLHPSTRGGGMAIKRFMRAARIEAGLRPLRFSTLHLRGDQ